MEDIERCTRCILPVSLPSVTIDAQGVCNHCRTYEATFKSWDDLKIQRKQNFENILRHAKGLNRTYDCLIPLSGGKDSTYCLYLASKVYGLKCLAVTFDNGFLSGHARRNIQNAIESTDADHMFYTVNRHLLLRLYKLFIQKCGTFCPVCLRGIGLALGAAEKNKIPLILSGAGRRVAYLSLVPEVFQEGTVDFFKNVVRDEKEHDTVRPMLVNVTSWNAKKISRVILNMLRIPHQRGRHHVQLYDHLDTPYSEIYDIIKKEMGWNAPQDKTEHMDCTLHNIAGYVHTLKFPELAYNTFHLSGLIRMGNLSRTEAVKLENDDRSRHQTAPLELNSFLSELGMTQVEFESSVKEWRKINQFRSGNATKIKNLYHRIVKN